MPDIDIHFSSMSPMYQTSVAEREAMVLVYDYHQWLTEYLIVVIVRVDMVPVEGYSQVGSHGVDMDGLELTGFEACLLVVR